MSEFGLGYEKIAPATWVYLSSLLMLTVYFKFARYWSLRNLDLIFLVLLAPGLIFQYQGVIAKYQASQLTVGLRAVSSLATNVRPADGSAEGLAANSSEADVPDWIATSATTLDRERQRLLTRGQRFEWFGYVWLFLVGAGWLVRLLLDPLLVRRPLLDPNLSLGGLIFLGCSLLVFLTANVLSSVPSEDDLKGPRDAAQMIRQGEMGESVDFTVTGPGWTWLHLLPTLPTWAMQELRPNRPAGQSFGGPSTSSEGLGEGAAAVVITRIMAIASQLTIVIGMALIGWRHFNNLTTGVAAATLYLMLPYTAMMTGRVLHVLPAAMLVMAVLAYRRPAVAGVFLGLSTGITYYPIFLLPLWTAFYRRRGWPRFLGGVGATLVVWILSHLATSPNWDIFGQQVRQTFGLWPPRMENLEGFWDLVLPAAYRIPVLAAFFILTLALAIWPARKNLGTLLSCSAALMLAVQFWHGFGGGLYMAYYLPLLILTVFRPNLEDRVAALAVPELRRIVTPRPRPRLKVA